VHGLVSRLLLPCSDYQLWVSPLWTVCRSCKNALYLPCRWLDQQLAPSASCTDGTLTSDNTVDVLLQACEDGYIGIPCYSDLCPADDVSSCNFMQSFLCFDDVHSSYLALCMFVVHLLSLLQGQDTTHPMMPSYSLSPPAQFRGVKAHCVCVCRIICVKQLDFILSLAQCL